MTRQHGFRIGCSIVLALPMLGFAVVFAREADAPPETAATARVTRVMETRSRPVGPAKGAAAFVGMFSDLSVTLALEGDAVRGTFAVAGVELAEAVDDTGGSLQPEDEFRDLVARSQEHVLAEVRKRLGDAQAEEMKRGFEEAKGAIAAAPVEVNTSLTTNDGDDDGGGGGVQVTLHLGASARKASTIRRLRGTLTVLAGEGEARKVTLDKPASRAGATAAAAEPVEDPALKEAGLSVKLLTVSEEEAEAAAEAGEPLAVAADGLLAVRVEGDSADLGEVRVVGADGEPVGSRLTSPDELKASGGRVLVLLEQPLDDTMTVEIDLHKGQRRVAVPFDFKDVELP